MSSQKPGTQLCKPFSASVKKTGSLPDDSRGCTVQGTSAAGVQSLHSISWAGHMLQYIVLYSQATSTYTQEVITGHRSQPAGISEKCLTRISSAGEAYVLVREHEVVNCSPTRVNLPSLNSLHVCFLPGAPQSFAGRVQLLDVQV